MASRAAMAAKGKAIMQAVVVDASAKSEVDPKRAKSLSTRVMQMKEDITAEVVARVATMQDREEMAVLTTAVRAISKSDTARALKLLEDRLAQLNRRMALRPDSDESDDGSDDDEAPAQNQAAGEAADSAQAPAGVGVLAGASEPAVVRSDDRAAWEVVGGDLSAACALGERGGDGGRGWELPEAHAALRAAIDAEGFFQCAAPMAGAAALCARILAGMRALRAAGVPTFFIWMFDEPWRVMLGVWDHAERILGAEVRSHLRPHPRCRDPTTAVVPPPRRRGRLRPRPRPAFSPRRTRVPHGSSAGS